MLAKFGTLKGIDRKETYTRSDYLQDLYEKILEFELAMCERPDTGRTFSSNSTQDLKFAHCKPLALRPCQLRDEKAVATISVRIEPPTRFKSP